MKKIIALLLATIFMVTFAVSAVAYSYDMRVQRNTIDSCYVNPITLSGKEYVRFYASVDSGIAVPIVSGIEMYCYQGGMEINSRNVVEENTDTVYASVFWPDTVGLFEMDAYGYTHSQDAMGNIIHYYEIDHAAYTNIPYTKSISEEKENVSKYLKSVSNNIIDTLQYDMNNFVETTLDDSDLPAEFIDYYFNTDKTEGHTKPTIFKNTVENKYIFVYCQGDGLKVIKEIGFNKVYSSGENNYNVRTYSSQGEFVSFNDYMIGNVK